MDTRDPTSPGVILPSARTRVTRSSRYDGTASPACTRCPAILAATCKPADIAFDEPLRGGCPRRVRVRDRNHSRWLRIAVDPESVYDYNFTTRELTLLKRTPVLDDPRFGSYQPENYVQERGWATAPDGTRVPLSIVRKAGVPLDGTAPALLYGYGSYEASMDPGFASRLSLLDRNRVCHCPRTWRRRARPDVVRTGQKLAKRNTFTDFIACGLPGREGLYIARPAGGPRRQRWWPAQGAVANLAPDRFRAIHASVPFVDALTTILNPELPLTVIEWEEWGDPLHDPDVYGT